MKSVTEMIDMIEIKESRLLGRIQAQIELEKFEQAKRTIKLMNALANSRYRIRYGINNQKAKNFS